MGGGRVLPGLAFSGAAAVPEHVQPGPLALQPASSSEASPNLGLCGPVWLVRHSPLPVFWAGPLCLLPRIKARVPASKFWSSRAPAQTP